MEWYQSPVIHATILTLITAVLQDLSSWKTWEDAAFNWKTASWRWVKALIIGIGGSFTLTSSTNALANQIGLQ